jgi:hypothetical protein
VSDVPELDRLIEQHKVFQYNIRWEAHERTRTRLLRLLALTMIVSVPTMLVGPAALLIAPVAWKWLRSAIPDPPRRDPFRRYRVM